jgi:hypothetical protein
VLAEGTVGPTSEEDSVANEEVPDLVEEGNTDEEEAADEHEDTDEEEDVDIEAPARETAPSRTRSPSSSTVTSPPSWKTSR